MHKVVDRRDDNTPRTVFAPERDGFEVSREASAATDRDPPPQAMTAIDDDHEKQPRMSRDGTVDEHDIYVEHPTRS